MFSWLYPSFIYSTYSMFFLSYKQLNKCNKRHVYMIISHWRMRSNSLSRSSRVAFLTVATGFNWVPVRNINCSISHLSQGRAERSERWEDFHSHCIQTASRNVGIEMKQVEAERTEWNRKQHRLHTTKEICNTLPSPLIASDWLTHTFNNF